MIKKMFVFTILSTLMFNANATDKSVENDMPSIEVETPLKEDIVIENGFTEQFNDSLKYMTGILLSSMVEIQGNLDKDLNKDINQKINNDLNKIYLEEIYKKDMMENGNSLKEYEKDMSTISKMKKETVLKNNKPSKQSKDFYYYFGIELKDSYSFCEKISNRIDGSENIKELYASACLSNLNILSNTVEEKDIGKIQVYLVPKICENIDHVAYQMSRGDNKKEVLNTEYVKECVLEMNKLPLGFYLDTQ